MTLSKTTKFLERITNQAAEFVLRHFNDRYRVDFKDEAHSDPVTNIDKECEALLIDLIRKEYPTDEILSEECGLLEGDKKRIWVIDPIDGTMNFIHHLPLFCVSVALFVDGNLFAGCVIAPKLNETYIAEKGKGAYLNGVKLQMKNDPKEWYRAIGTAALHLAWMASGRFTALHVHSLHPWDFAAGKLLVEEAGGIVSDLHGNQLPLFEKADVFASTKSIFIQHFHKESL